MLQAHSFNVQKPCSAPSRPLVRIISALRPLSSHPHRQRPRLPQRTAALPPLADLHVDHQALADLADAAVDTVKKSDLITPLSDGLETVLKRLQDGLQTLHVPYSYGFSIILLTLIVKIVTFPLTKKQVESSMAVQKLKPRVELIKARFGDDKDKVQKETSLLYEKAGVNPLAGCLPSLATIPIFIGLYRSLTNVASEGLLDTEGFFWIPNLAGPTTIAARQAGSGTAWLWPLVEGAPPIGWQQASAYLVLPVLLVVVQYISTAIVSPPINDDDKNANTTKALYVFLPLMVGWFSLNVPSGLGLYYFSNTVLTSLIQIWLKKLGGADVQINDLGPVTKLGAGRRTGEPVLEPEMWTSQVMAAAQKAEAGDAAAAAAAATAAAALAEAPSSNGTSSSISRRCKRKQLQVA